MTLKLKLANDAITILSSSITSTDTTINIEDSSNFPSLLDDEWFPLTLISGSNVERMAVIEINGNTLTVVRGEENTLSQNWENGTSCYLGLTAAAIESVEKNLNTVAVSGVATKNTNSYTLASSDAGLLVEMASDTDNIVYINSGVFKNTQTVTIVQSGNGQTTITPGDGVIIKSQDSYKTRNKNSAIQLVCTGADEFYLFGSLEAL